MITRILNKLGLKKPDVKQKAKSEKKAKTDKVFSFSSKLIFLIILALLVLSSVNLGYQVLTNKKSIKNMKYCLNADQIMYEGTVVNGRAISFNENKMLGCTSMNKINDKTYEFTYVNNNAVWNPQYVRDHDLKCTTIVNHNISMALDANCSPVSKIWQCSVIDGVWKCSTNQNPIIEKRTKNKTVYEIITPALKTFYTRQSVRLPQYQSVFERIGSAMYLKFNKGLNFKDTTIEPVAVVNNTKNKL